MATRQLKLGGSWVLQDMQHAITELTAILKRSFGDKYSELELDALIHAILDIEESSRAIVRIVQALRDSSPSDNLADGALVDIGEELAHIVYHAADTEAFRPFLERGLAAREDAMQQPAS